MTTSEAAFAFAWCDCCRRTHIVIDSAVGQFRFDMGPEETAELAKKAAGAAIQAAAFLPTEKRPQCLLTLAEDGDGRPS